MTALCSACASPLVIPKNNTPAAPADLVLARSTLARVNTYTNMSDAQLARVQEATRALDARQAKRVLDLLNPLEIELNTETKPYIVKTNDSLWSIAAREDVYANGQLWPLLARVNAAVLSKNGYQVHAGQKIFVKLHPTIAESVQAIRDAERGNLTVISP